MLETDSRPQYPIRTAARRTGLSPHVLRAWERRYAVVEPARHGGGRRLYSNADILHFQLLRRLVEAGHGIGSLARLSTAQLLGMLGEERDLEPLPPPPPMTAAHRHLEDILLGVEAMDDRRVHASLMRGVVALSAHEFVEGVALPLLHRVGTLWKKGALCPAHEHLLSVQLGRILGWLADTIPLPEGAPTAVAVTPPGQRHEFGAVLAGVVAAEEGWRVTYLGPDLPAGDIAAALDARGAGVLMLSAVVEDRGSPLPEVLREIRDAAGRPVRILVGGRGAERHREAIERDGDRWLPDLSALRIVLREIHPAGAAA